MADNRIKTTIELKVDDRDVRNLNKTVSRAFDEKSVKDFERAVERSSRAMAVLATASTRAAKANYTAMGVGIGRGGGGGSGGGPGGVGGGGGDTRELIASIRELTAAMRANGPGGGGKEKGESFFSRTGSTAIGTYLGNRTSQVGGLVGGSVGGSGMTAGIAGAIPLLGSAISGAINGIRSIYGEFVQQQAAESGSVGATGRGLGGFQDPAQAWGLDASQAPGVMAEFSQQSQLTGRALTDRFATKALEYKMLGGIGNASSIVGAANTSGGAVANPEKLMAQAISAGMRAGIKDSKLSDYMGQVAGWAEQTRAGGFNIAPESVLQMIEGYSKVGLRGESAIRNALSASAAIRGMGKGSSSSDMMALTAVGYGQGTSYYDARKMLEKSPEKVMPQILKMMGQGGSLEGRMRVFETMFAPIAGTMSVEDMEKLMGGDTSGFGAELGTAESSGLLTGRAGLLGKFAVGAHEAGNRNARFAVGGSDSVRTAAQAVEDADILATKIIAPMMAPIVKGVANTVTDGLRAFSQGTLKAWGDDLVIKLAAAVAKAVREAINPQGGGGRAPLAPEVVKEPSFTTRGAGTRAVAPQVYDPTTGTLTTIPDGSPILTQ